MNGEDTGGDKGFRYFFDLLSELVGKGAKVLIKG